MYQAIRVKSATSRVLDHLDVDVDKNMLCILGRGNINSESTRGYSAQQNKE